MRSPARRVATPHVVSSDAQASSENGRRCQAVRRIAASGSEYGIHAGAAPSAGNAAA